METKSTDRKQTLLHYIANVVREKYPAVCMFYNELHYVEKAAAGKTLYLIYYPKYLYGAMKRCANVEMQSTKEMQIVVNVSVIMLLVLVFIFGSDLKTLNPKLAASTE